MPPRQAGAANVPLRSSRAMSASAVPQDRRSCQQRVRLRSHFADGDVAGRVSLPSSLSQLVIARCRRLTRPSRSWTRWARSPTRTAPSSCSCCATISRCGRQTCRRAEPWSCSDDRASSLLGLSNVHSGYDGVHFDLQWFCDAWLPRTLLQALAHAAHALRVAQHCIHTRLLPCSFVILHVLHVPIARSLMPHWDLDRRMVLEADQWLQLRSAHSHAIGSPPCSAELPARRRCQAPAQLPWRP